MRPTFERFVAPGPDTLTTGGRCLAFVNAATAALLIGDTVFLSAAGGVVDKSAVTADHLKRVGLVVGGRSFYNEASQDVLDIGEIAAAINQPVLVATEGVVYAVSDGTAILAGSYVAPSVTTAGRVRLATVTTDLVAGDTGKILGLAVDANGSVAGTKIRILLQRM